MELTDSGEKGVCGDDPSRAGGITHSKTGCLQDRRKLISICLFPFTFVIVFRIGHCFAFAIISHLPLVRSHWSSFHICNRSHPSHRGPAMFAPPMLGSWDSSHKAPSSPLASQDSFQQRGSSRHSFALCLSPSALNNTLLWRFPCRTIILHTCLFFFLFFFSSFFLFSFFYTYP